VGGYGCAFGMRGYRAGNPSYGSTRSTNIAEFQGMGYGIAGSNSVYGSLNDTGVGSNIHNT
jgi:hypothetical protein